MKATVRHGLTILLTLAMVVLSVTAQAERKLLDRVVAIVDDEVILQSELDARINTIVGRLSAQGTGLPPRELLEQRPRQRAGGPSRPYRHSGRPATFRYPSR